MLSLVILQNLVKSFPKECRQLQQRKHGNHSNNHGWNAYVIKLRFLTMFCHVLCSRHHKYLNMENAFILRGGTGKEHSLTRVPLSYMIMSVVGTGSYCKDKKLILDFSALMGKQDLLLRHSSVQSPN